MGLHFPARPTCLHAGWRFHTWPAPEMAWRSFDVCAAWRKSPPSCRPQVQPTRRFTTDPRTLLDWETVCLKPLTCDRLGVGGLLRVTAPSLSSSPDTRLLGSDPTSPGHETVICVAGFTEFPAKPDSPGTDLGHVYHQPFLFQEVLTSFFLRIWKLPLATGRFEVPCSAPQL